MNNAGRVARKPAVELTVEEWQAVIDVNLTATFVLLERSRSLYESARRRGHRQTLASLSWGFRGVSFPTRRIKRQKGAS